MTPKVPVPARLFVLLAREAPIGVMLRRGPYRWVQLIKWNTATDTFETGQWLHAQVYEYAGDLSPDGNLLLYIAYKRYNHDHNPDYNDVWIAISKPPYFTALALWRPDHRPVGGHFIDNNTVQLYGRFSEHPNHPISENLNVIHDIPKYLPYPHHDSFLQLRGWEPLEPPSQPTPDEFYYRVDRNAIWQKHSNDLEIRVRHLGWITGKPGGSGYQFEYSVVNQSSGQHFILDDVTWADFDQQKRLVLAREGKIFSAVLNNEGELSLTELADFNANKPDPAPSPDWAKKW